MSTSLPEKMRVVRFSKTGGPEVLEDATVDLPKLEPDQVLIKVEWAGVNFIDTYFRAGLYPAKLPFTSGQEGAGIIAKLPEDQSVLSDPLYKELNLEVGDKVGAYASGMFAEYTAVSWKKLFTLPQHVTTKDAASSTVSGLTALTFLTESYEPKKGEWILVHAAAGGLGQQLCQIGKELGARVIGTTSTEEKAKIARECGAEEVVIYTKENTVEVVNKLTGGQGVSAVYDGVGKSTWEANFDLIARKGTIVSIGNASGAVEPFPPLKLTPKNLKVLRPTVANYVATPEELRGYTARYFGLLEAGKIKPANIFKEYEFSAEGVKQSQLDITSGKTTGKLLVKITA